MTKVSPQSFKMNKIPFTSKMTKIAIKYLKDLERCFCAVLKLRKFFSFKTKLGKIHNSKKIAMSGANTFIVTHLPSRH